MEKSVIAVPHRRSQWTAESIPDSPHMESEGRDLLIQHLRASDVFLEYGSGGSSVQALRNGVRRIYSVDSDAAFLKAVWRRLKWEGAVRGQFVPLYADIGVTGAWGRPLDASNAIAWPNYCSLPWAQLRHRGDQPGLVLIDGRFRVACFLFCALMAQPGCVILFDDYFDRPYYHAVEQYFKPTRAAGRLAEFIIQDFERPDLAMIDLMAYCSQPQ